MIVGDGVHYMISSSSDVINIDQQSNDDPFVGRALCERAFMRFQFFSSKLKIDITRPKRYVARKPETDFSMERFRAVPVFQ